MPRRLKQPEQYHQTIITLFKFFFPFALAAIGIITIFLVIPERRKAFEFLGFVLAYSVPPLGKESIIPGAIAAGFDPLMIALYITAVDGIQGLFYAWNWDLTLKIPILGRGIKYIMDRGAAIVAQRPRLRELAYTGIFVYMIVPFQGSNSLGATVTGRILGMSPSHIWGIVVVGGLFSSLLMAYASNTIIEIFKTNALLAIAILGAVIFVGHLIYHHVLKKNHVANHLKEAPKRRHK